MAVAAVGVLCSLPREGRRGGGAVAGAGAQGVRTSCSYTRWVMHVLPQAGVGGGGKVQGKALQLARMSPLCI